MDEEMKFGFCLHCGTKIMNDKHVSGSVSIDKNPEIINHLKMAREHASNHDWEALTKLVEKILLMDAECSDAWYMSVLLSMPQADDGTLDSLMSKGDKGKKYEIFFKDDIAIFWGEHTITFRTYSKKPMMISQKTWDLAGERARMIVTLDGGKESFCIRSNQKLKFGLTAGIHDLTIQIVVDGSTRPGVLKLVFTVEKDMDIELTKGSFFQYVDEKRIRIG